MTRKRKAVYDEVQCLKRRKLELSTDIDSLTATADRKGRKFGAKMLITLKSLFSSLLHSRVNVAESGRQTSEPREISREVGDPSINSFADYSQSSASQVLQEKAHSTAD